MANGLNAALQYILDIAWTYSYYNINLHMISYFYWYKYFYIEQGWAVT